MHGRHLVEAMQSGDMTLARGLLMAQADPNSARDALGRTPLHLAASAGLLGICRQLVQQGANLDVGTPGHGHTALHLAAMHRHLNVLKLLLQARASPNVVGAGLESPLKLCVNDGNIEGIQLLLRARAQVDPQEDEVAALDVTQPVGALRARVGGGAPLSADGGGGAPAAAMDCEERPCSAGALLRAVQRNGQKELLEELIAARADVDARDADQNRPLHLAARHGRTLDTRVVRLLLDNRADPNSCNLEMRTPAHCAAGAGLGRVVRMLAEHRADVNREDRQGLTPLQMASDPAVASQIRGLGGRFGTSAYARCSSVPSLGSGGFSTGASPATSRRNSIGSRGASGLRLKMHKTTPHVLTLSQTAPMSPKSTHSLSPPSSPVSAGATITFGRAPIGRRGSFQRQPDAAWTGGDF